MDTLVLFSSHISGLFVDPVLAQSSEGLVNTLRGFIGPIFLLVAGIAAMTFLFQRQIMQFIIFAVIFVLVAAVFYGPQLFSNLGRTFATNNQGWGG